MTYGQDMIYTLLNCSLFFSTKETTSSILSSLYLCTCRLLLSMISQYGLVVTVSHSSVRILWKWIQFDGVRKNSLFHGNPLPLKSRETFYLVLLHRVHSSLRITFFRTSNLLSYSQFVIYRYTNLTPSLTSGTPPQDSLLSRQVSLTESLVRLCKEN